MKKNTLLLLIIAICTSLIGGTYLYYTTDVAASNNKSPKYYYNEEVITINNWTPGTETAKDLKVTNDKKVNVATRIKVVESWTAVDGTILDGYSEGEKLVKLNIGEDWALARDGYYYYQSTLKQGDETTNFITSIIFNPNFELVEGRDIICTKTINGSTITATCKNTTSGYNGATYKLSFIIEVIEEELKWSYDTI